MKKILIILFISISISNYAFSEEAFDIKSLLDLELKPSSYRDNLYINIIDPKVISTLDTMTYYVSSEMKPDEYMLDSFKYFSENIGITNGAVFIALDEYKSYINHLPNIAFIDMSYCDKKIFNRDVIIIEDRVNKNCAQFPIEKSNYLISILSLVTEKIENINDLKNESNMLSLRKAVNKNFEKLDIPSENIEILDILINFLRTKFSL